MKKKEIKSIVFFNIKKFNSVIRILTISDVITISGFGLISPIFAIFIVGSIEGGSIEVVGIAMTIFLLTKSLGQIPAGIIIDRIKGENDDFWAMFVGSLCYSLIPLLYIFISTPIQLYIVQFFYGLSVALTYPSWYAIFTRHIDHHREGIEWGVYNTLIDLGAAGAAAIGGFVASKFGFVPLFVVISMMSFIGSAFLLLIQKDLKKT